MSAEVVMKSGGRRTIDTRTLKMSTDHEGVFEMKLYLRTELGKFCINENVLKILKIKSCVLFNY